MDERYLANIIQYLTIKGYFTNEIKNIPYGVQFYVSDGQIKELIRIYHNIGRISNQRCGFEILCSRLFV